MKNKTKTYLIGMPEATRAKLRNFWSKFGIRLLITVACVVCFAVGYLWGMTCFYYG